MICQIVSKVNFDVYLKDEKYAKRVNLLSIASFLSYLAVRQGHGLILSYEISAKNQIG